MASLITLKQEIQFNTRLANVLDALKSIAAQQFQALERTLQTNDRFFEAVETIAGTFPLERFSHPYTRSEGPVGVVMITSDTGLLGGLNQQVVAVGLEEYRHAPGELIVIGERGVTYVREAGLPCRRFPAAVDTERFQLAAAVRDYALQRVLSGGLSRLTIVHPRALSFTVQRVEVVRALPCMEWFRSSAVPRGIRSDSLMLESSVADVVEYLVWLWVEEKLVALLGMARLAELAARSVHLEGSSQELQRRGQKLWLRYFRERHEVIDRNMRELFSARSLFQEPSTIEEPSTVKTVHHPRSTVHGLEKEADLA